MFTYNNKKYNSSEPVAFKSQRLTKNYCITSNIKIIRSIHIFILKILGSHELKPHCHF